MGGRPVIAWQDVSHTLTASGRLPPDVFRKPLARMEAAWGESGLAKQAVNSMIGLWAREEGHVYKLFSSPDPRDAPEVTEHASRR